jgi:general secretion pathway protein D
MIVEEGEYLKQGGAPTSFASRIDVATGQIFITAARNNNDGATGNANLLSVSFKGLAAASSTNIQLSAFAPIGLEGKTVSLTLPSAQVIGVSPILLTYLQCQQYLKNLFSLR